MNRFIPALLLACVAGSVFGMGGAPVIIVGQKMTSMTVEGTHAVMEMNSPTSTVVGDKISSERFMISARYGMLPNIDICGQIGVASLTFRDLNAGYASYNANWSPAWGADVRIGFPTKAQPFQVLAAVKYFGFNPRGSISNGQKTIESKYFWNEVTPTVTAGYAMGPFVPYVGVMKQYLFGQKEVSVALNGQHFEAAGGKTSYADGEQNYREVLGLEWRGPDGYLVTAEAIAGPNGVLTLSLGLSQVIK
jgi:hypothetical protein